MLLQNIGYCALALIWGVLILFSWAGWGTLVADRLPAATRPGWGMRAAYGMSLLTVAGGFINLAGMVSPLLMIGLVLAGLLLASREADILKPAWLTRLNRYRIAAVLVPLTVFYIIWGLSGRVIAFDDNQGYLSFTTEMLQTGSIGQQPFNHNRMCAYGGQNFLQGFLLALFPAAKLVHIIDPGICLFICFALLMEMAQELKIRPGGIIILILAFFCIPIEMPNTSSMETSLVLFMLLYRSFTFSPAQGKHAVAAGALKDALALAALCSLKNNVLPPCMVYLFFRGCHALLQSNRRQLLLQLALTALLAVFFLMPWAILMKQSSGTYFYPLLGQGYNASNFDFPRLHSLKPKWHVMLASPLVWYLAFIGLIAQHYAPDKKSRTQCLMIALSGFTSIVLFHLMLPSVPRYIYGFVYAAILLVTCYALAWVHIRLWPLIIIGLSIVLKVVVTFNSGGRHYRFADSLPLYEAMNTVRELSYQHGNDTSDLQSYIPDHSSVLSITLDAPLKMDFRRHKFYLADLITKGPPPGLPQESTQEKMVQYLHKFDIHHVIINTDRCSAGTLNGKPANPAFCRFITRLVTLGDAGGLIASNGHTQLIDIDLGMEKSAELRKAEPKKDKNR